MSNELILPPFIYKADIFVLDKPIKDSVAFVELSIYQQEELLFIVRGYRIRIKDIENKIFYDVDAPAYKSGYRYKKSFLIEHKETWRKVSDYIIQEFCDINGGLSAVDYFRSQSQSALNVESIAL